MCDCFRQMVTGQTSDSMLHRLDMINLMRFRLSVQFAPLFLMVVRCGFLQNIGKNNDNF